MDIKRSDLIRMVAEEVRALVRELYEAEDEKTDGKKKSKGKRPQTKDASDEPTKKKSDGPTSPKAAPPPGDNAAGVEDPVAQGDPGDEEDDLDLPGDEEMADDNTDAEEDEEDAIDADGDAAEDEASGEVAQAISGLSVQSLTVEPESELLPGSKEIVFTFNDSPDVLRILVDNVGNVVFSWNGQLHDIP